VRALLLACLLAGACAPRVTEPPSHHAPPPPHELPAVIDAACSQDGCVRRLVADLGSYALADLQPLLQPNVQIQNGYRVLTIEYLTDGRTSTATVTLPFDVDDADAAYPIVANAHGTIGVDDPCSLSGTVSGAGLAGLFGARGAIGVAPDYPGLGTDGVHAYLSTRSEGTSVLDALRAASVIARHEGYAVSGANAIVGLSQGGHAVLAAASLHASYAPELDIRAFGITAPAAVYEEQWRGGLRFYGAHIPNYALLVWDWAELAGAPQDMWVDGVREQIDGWMHERCMWSPAFGTEPTLYDALGTDPSLVFTPEFVAAFDSGDIDDDASPWRFLHDTFAANRVVPFAQTAPIRIWQGDADTTVNPAYTHQLVDDLNAAGMDVEITDVAGGTHIDTAFGFVASAEHATTESVAWIEDALRP
jgi:hypothetical protein